MKNLKQYIQEKLIVNKNYKTYKYHPKSWNELRQIIADRYEELGIGTEQKPIDFNDVDVSGIDTFYNHTENCGLFEYSKFKYIDISDWNVSNVTNMRNMFYMCKQLKSIDISDWDVSNVENVGYMFSSCISLESIGDISDWKVSRINNMTNMFYNCKNLESIGDLSKWKVSKVKEMINMFYDCYKLQSIGDISNWDVSGVKTKRFMFDNSGITNIPDWYKE